MAFTLAYSIIVPTLTIIALLYAGIEDFLFREVRREIVWLLMIVFGLILDIVYIFFPNYSEQALSDILINIVLGFVVGFILFYSGAWGGADTKALWAISVLSPIYPFENNILGLTIPELRILDDTVFSILLNSGLLVIFYPIILILINTISSRKGSLFDEVNCTFSQKARAFCFGYRKNVDQINPNKFHFDFMEELPDKEFEGQFIGNFSGKADGKIAGMITGKINGQFIGKTYGILQEISKDLSNELSPEKIVQLAEKYHEILEYKLEEEDEDLTINMLLKKYRKDFSLIQDDFVESLENFVSIYDGGFSFPVNKQFIGVIEGQFEGEFDGEIIGRIEGDFSGTSSKGKLSGTSDYYEPQWQIKIRTFLENDQKMETRQLRTLWQLKSHKKKSVWIMPGVPFVTLMLFGYILYLLIGNIALLLFV